MIDYRCPRCKKSMSSPESLMGEPESCPECGYVTTVPAHRIADRSAPSKPLDRAEAPPMEVDRVPATSKPEGSGEPAQRKLTGRLLPTRPALIAVAVISICFCVWLFWPVERRFSLAELDRYSQTVVRLDETINFWLVTQPSRHSANMLAFRLKGKPTKPIEIWKKARPLLEKRSPNPIEIREMREHIGNLQLLAAMFKPAGVEGQPTETEKQLRELLGKIIDWQYEL